MHAFFAILRIERIHQTQRSLQLNVMAVQLGHPKQTTVPIFMCNERLSHCQSNVSLIPESPYGDLFVKQF